MSTPINQLPPSEPIANDPGLVQFIIKESMNESQQQLPQTQPQLPQTIPILSPSYYPKYKQHYKSESVDYMNIIKKIIIVSILVFIVQVKSIKEYIRLYISSKELNLLIRALIAGMSYIGLDMVF